MAVRVAHLNVEIKARCPDQERIRAILAERKADFRGKDHQIDTYFRVASGRLKLREGNIENHLIAYQREEKIGLKECRVTLYASHDPETLKAMLAGALGILATVDKKREIYFLENVKFHLDEVKGLGQFMEIEAIDPEGSRGRKALSAQCRYYLDLFGIREEDLVPASYCELLLQTGGGKP